MGSDSNEESLGGHSEQIPEEKIFRILEGQGFKITKSSSTEIFPDATRTDGLEGISENGKRALENLIARCKEYVTGVIIEDGFGDTFEGRQARDDAWVQLTKKYGKRVSDIHKSDKLRLGSSVNTAKAYFEWLVSELDASHIASEQADTIRALYAEFLAAIPHDISEESGQMTIVKYGKMDFQEKVAAVGQIEDVLRKFLRFITKDSNQIDSGA